MRISARADYAVRAAIELAAASEGEVVRAETLATRQDIPLRFLEAVLTDLRRGGLVTSQRGARGGHRLARPASAITLADVVRAIEGPLVFVNGERPSDLEFTGAAETLLPVWVAVRSAVRGVLEGVSLAEIVGDTLPAVVTDLAERPGAWDNEP